MEDYERVEKLYTMIINGRFLDTVEGVKTRSMVIDYLEKITKSKGFKSTTDFHKRVGEYLSSHPNTQNA